MSIRILQFLTICTFVGTNLYSCEINIPILPDCFNIQNNISNINNNNTQDKGTQTDIVIDVDSDNEFTNLQSLKQTNNNILKNNKEVLCIEINNTEYNIDNKKQSEKNISQNIMYSPTKKTIIKKIKVNKNTNMNNKHYLDNKQTLNNTSENNLNDKLIPCIKVGTEYYFKKNYIENEYLKNKCKVGVCEIMRKAHKTVYLQDKIIINNYKVVENNIYTTPNIKPKLQSYNYDSKHYNRKNIVNNNYMTNNGRNLLNEYNNDNVYNYVLMTPQNNHNKVQNSIIISISPIKEKNSSNESYKTNNYETNTRRNLLKQFNACVKDNTIVNNTSSTNYKSYNQNNNKSINIQIDNEIKKNLCSSIFNNE